MQRPVGGLAHRRRAPQQHAKAAPAHRHARRSSCGERYRRLRRHDPGPTTGLVLTPNAKHREGDHDRATVDVIDGSGTVAARIPITLGESNNVDDSEYLAKALESAAHGQLMPDAALGTITAEIHTGPAVRMTLLTAMISRNVRKRRLVWSRQFGNAAICSERKRDALETVRKSSRYPALGEHLRERATPVAI